MKLKSLNKYISFLIFLIFFSPLSAEEEKQIDIWSKEKKENSEKIINDKNSPEETNNSNIFQSLKKNQNIKIENEIIENSQDKKIFGLYDPADNDFDLNMWSNTNAEDVRSSIQRIKKIKLSNLSKKIFENTFFSFAYPPQGMDDKEFVNLKINWMIANKEFSLIEEFLKQNNTFYNKKVAIQYLVDENIAKANIQEGCDKVNFLDKNIKDSYLEKFKIYCLVFNNKKNEAQLLYDILKEQKKSDDFFDDKISFLIGITNKTSNKIKEDNLLNFYLSSITIDQFKYEPKKNTKKIIWEYLNAANLIQLEDVEDKEKLKNLEAAANSNQLEKKKIFDIYKRIPFPLNTLMNADNVYQTLNTSDARALIYQKFLLSDNDENKVKLLFLLEDLFNKDNLSNIYSKFMVDKLKEINPEKLSDSYKEVVEKKLIVKEEFKLGKIKFNDKILHKSKIIRYYLGEVDKKKTQKDFNKIYKKIIKNKKYFFSAKDLALVETLTKDGFIIPKGLNKEEISKKYSVPQNLLELTKNNQAAFLALKIVEIIGEDEAYDLDPETIYFITHLLNQTNLKNLRNEILISALPERS